MTQAGKVLTPVRVLPSDDVVDIVEDPKEDMVDIGDDMKMNNGLD